MLFIRIKPRTVHFIYLYNILIASYYRVSEHESEIENEIDIQRMIDIKILYAFDEYWLIMSVRACVCVDDSESIQPVYHYNFHPFFSAGKFWSEKLNGMKYSFHFALPDTKLMRCNHQNALVYSRASLNKIMFRLAKNGFINGNIIVCFCLQSHVTFTQCLSFYKGVWQPPFFPSHSFSSTMIQQK